MRLRIYFQFEYLAIKHLNHASSMHLINLYSLCAIILVFNIMYCFLMPQTFNRLIEHIPTGNIIQLIILTISIETPEVKALIIPIVHSNGEL